MSDDYDCFNRLARWMNALAGAGKNRTIVRPNELQENYSKSFFVKCPFMTFRSGLG